MYLRINEIFYSIQGEGRHAGRAAIFVRFAGCNLQCPFCDTNHTNYFQIEEEKLVEYLLQQNFPAQFVVLTGGEPTLQITDEFINLLHCKGFEIAIETNGTHEIKQSIDWITISPKFEYVGRLAQLKQLKANEVKIIVDENSRINDCGIQADYYYIQPCDTGDAERNQKIYERCINFIKENPKWKLSIQLQKILRVQ